MNVVTNTKTDPLFLCDVKVFRKPAATLKIRAANARDARIIARELYWESWGGNRDDINVTAEPAEPVTLADVERTLDAEERMANPPSPRADAATFAIAVGVVAVLVVSLVAFCL